MCDCKADDPRACWAVKYPSAWLSLGKNPRCYCPCHKGQPEAPDAR